MTAVLIGSISELCSGAFPEYCSRGTSLFVAQGLDGVEPRGAHRGNHAADHSYRSENKNGNQQRARRDDQTNVTAFGILRHRTIEGKPSDGERDRVGQHDSQRSADESNGEGFGEELRKDVSSPRTQRFLYSDLTCTLCHRD